MGIESEKLVIMVATMTGNAEVLAEDVQADLGGPDMAEIRLIENAAVSGFPTSGLLLVISSTYGTGDVPETAQEAFDSLKQAKPDLRSLTYGVISLGDRSYVDTFAKGGEHWDEVLRDCGAQRAGEVLKIDCQSGDDPADLANPWVTDWLKLARDRLPEAS